MSDSIFSLLFPKKVGIFHLYILSNYSFEIEVCSWVNFKLYITKAGDLALVKISSANS